MVLNKATYFWVVKLLVPWKDAPKWWWIKDDLQILQWYEVKKIITKKNKSKLQ